MLLQENKQHYPACNKVISHLTAVSEELVDVPLYFSLHDVCKTVKCTPPKADVLRSALINAGESLGSVLLSHVVSWVGCKVAWTDDSNDHCHCCWMIVTITATAAGRQ